MDFIPKSVEFHVVDAEPALSSQAEKGAENAGYMNQHLHM